jgi:hypothetical protein
MRRQMVEKVPQVHGYKFESIEELIEEIPKDGFGLRGKERFWMSLYLPGLPGFGTMERGEVWKGPMSSSTSS